MAPLNYVARNSIAIVVLSALGVLGCDGSHIDDGDDPRDGQGYLTRVFTLEGPCTVEVEGYGAVDVEEDYLPNVVACENGGAPPEALKAQAVQARGFLYYKLFVAGVEVIRNSQSDQVYRCNHRPNGAGQEHIDAVVATRGQYLVWDDRIIAPFYVAGSTPSDPDPTDPLRSCSGAGGAASTERYVTYNWGRTGCAIDMSPLGWVPSDCERNPHNRGCASQNGESCLSNLGWQYQDMFRYYYGEDIELVTSTGACGGDPPAEMTETDRWCSSRSDGLYCFDAQRLVSCSMGTASSCKSDAQIS